VPDSADIQEEISVHEMKAVRVYDLAEHAEGYRVLVDRLWPRGVRKETLRLDAWEKEVAPSRELRQWFGHERERFEQFATAYRKELDENPVVESFCDKVAEQLQMQDVLLLYAAKDEEHNNAVVLLSWLRDRLRTAGTFQ
jgi:uncharacterized protein YeaO (DUF488 family)